MTDLVERLRDIERRRVPAPDICGEAATEIERLRAADRLMVAQFLDQEREATEQAKEIERLRDALEFVLEAASWHFDGDADPLNGSPEDMTAHINGLIVQRVREALGE